ncbi:MAG: hydroxymethylbilane synthase [Gemmatimonadota bacterium]|nr:hydroxymethylbilane synthase [Gemmatimonadota bacterium]
MSALRLGTRGSPLALTQSALVREALGVRGLEVEVDVIQTTGDRDRSTALSRIGGKGLFTKELDLALLEERIDFAVHSLKDLPTEGEPGLALAVVPEREDPRDVLIGPGGRTGRTTLDGLARGSRVGTSSLRRRALARAFRPDWEVDDIRGNLDTRIGKVDRGEWDAIVVAAAGVRRLGLWNRVGEALERTAWLPAPGQGALGLVTRADDRATRNALDPLDHPLSRAAVRAERAVLAALGGGCQTPVGALGLTYEGGIRLWGLVASVDGKRVVRGDLTGGIGDPESLGLGLADLLRRRGADELLEENAPAPPVSHP